MKMAIDVYYSKVKDAYSLKWMKECEKVIGELANTLKPICNGMTASYPIYNEKMRRVGRKFLICSDAPPDVEKIFQNVGTIKTLG